MNRIYQIGGLIILLLSLSLTTACEDSGQPISITDRHPEFIDVSVSPSVIELTVEDVGENKQILIALSVIVDDIQEDVLVASLLSASDRRIMQTDTLKKTPDEHMYHKYSGEFLVEGRYQDFESMDIFVHSLSNEKPGKNHAQASVRVYREPTGYPVIDTITYNKEIRIPADSERAFFITAKVYNSLLDDFIASVHLDLFQDDGTEIAQYRMSDVDPFYGNVSGDSIYVQGFTVNPTNQPSDYRFKIYAVDRAGTHSDTLTHRFSFVN
ncbi:hypothetical protein QLX67_03910 [Balneolaceae bacterium ANBcel3]|nr:hypothetical protein [Balneolaceae bacterium ANBcel3]